MNILMPALSPTMEEGKLARTTVMLWSTWFFIALAYYGLFSWLPKIFAAAMPPATAPTASGLKWKTCVSTTGTKLSINPIAPTSSRSGSCSAKPAP